jgi:hypothetical protein
MKWDKVGKLYEPSRWYNHGSWQQLISILIVISSRIAPFFMFVTSRIVRA